jgi:hypothetical protein
LQGELSRVIQDFNNMNTEEIIGHTTIRKQIISQHILPENDLNVAVNKITEFIFKLLNKRNSYSLLKKTLNYINNQHIKFKSNL